MGNDDKPSNWVDQTGDNVPVNDDVDKQHGRTLGKLKSAATSRQTEVPETELEGDKHKGLDKEGKHKDAGGVKDTHPEYDRDAHERNLADAELERDRNALKEHENRITKSPEIEPSKKEKLLDKVDELVDKADNLFRKASPYVDDIAKVLGNATRVLGPISSTIGFFYPESTIDEETEQRLLKEWEEKSNVPIDPLLENSPNKDVIIENESPPIDIPLQKVSSEEPIDLAEVPEVQNLFNQLDEFSTDKDVPFTIESFDLDMIDYEDQEDGMDMDMD
ncbi:MAG: hypothetical protein DHS20C13_22110 [Thermodesulfobacteriota bacterium]|nr:MAG: hypothetical protein DHS20C13_22110 [Thermodesulfobacteriota bacterium]GJM35908.1 MAG: hypothetical protein DHS20C18_49090 [Saprospiraceae bacterium]